MEKLNNPKALLENSWKLYVDNLAGLLKIALVPALLTFAVSLVAGPFLAPYILKMQPVGNEMPALPSMFFITIGIVALANVLISVWGHASILSAIIGLDTEPINVKKAFAQGWYWYASIIFVALLTTIILIPAFILLFVPGIWLSLSFAFATYVLIAENKRGMEAIKASYSYVKGYWWAVFGRFLLIGIIIGVPTIILTSAFGKDSAIGNVLNLVISFAAAPYIVIYTYGLYKNLRAIKANAGAQV